MRGLDLRRVEGEHELVEADVRDADAVARAAEGVDAIVHGAALHGVHLRRWSEQDFWSINATGTFNVFEAARKANVQRFVLASTMGVYGVRVEAAADAWAVVDEETPTRPLDVYGLSKLLCEEMGRHYARVHGMRVVALRFGMYVPETFERYGFRLLFGGVDNRDVAQSVLLALEHEPPADFDAFDVMADTPFAQEEARDLARDPVAVIERHWPGASDLFRERELDTDALLWGRILWPVEKAKRELGYRPAYGFGEFLDALRRDDASHYPFAGLAQWGV